ncbi:MULTISPECIES: DNA polymerase Y family protein [unclassified Variovorax]|jgi:protein ImuB|uniref:DNA polymerase Y family protein n=1 Tax=unclassified Variovorax TaxID=663243 RepID=UPI000F7E921C|nr:MULTISPECIES: DNA polymerase Y family protein [unclassified Variovorax]RSZ33157.1 DNA polymerase Y family protein [Variovorax sp. 553]RSZ33529.1 DNA polymerase Y family protein [Variovorax sp. 679]
MHWIALQWLPEADTPDTPGAPTTLPTPEALGWWALQYTPHVAWQDEALMLEVSACERLWGGRMQLMRLLVADNPAPDARMLGAQGATSLIALARLRLFARDEKRPKDVPAGLPLYTLSAAHEHLDLLERLGCRTWGEVAALPRGGLTRRFGAGLREALDIAWGLRPESHAWLTLPDVFEQKLELPALAETAPELMWSANRLLTALQFWLRARQRGARALELQWTLDLRRLNGVNLPPHEQLIVRTAEPTQDMAHLRRLLSEKLALATLAAPASWLSLRTLETDPWAGASTSFLPEDNRKGDRLHEMVERLSVRLGPQQVVVPVAQADHRPERKQAWRPALQKQARLDDKARKEAKAAAAAASQPDAVYPPWLLPEPLLLEMDGERPCYCGPLSRLVGPQRVETGWWGDKEDGGQPAMRDYYVAESPEAGLVWIFRERPAARFSSGEVRWYLQGFYA